jgi:ComF family protein
LCSECAQRLAQLAAQPACDRCAKPVALPGSPCPWCLGRGIYPFHRVVRLAEFTEPLRTLIHQAKYQRRWPLAELLAQQLSSRPDVRELLAGCEWLVPVPLHFRRQFWRGYNQSQVLAQRLGRLCNVKVLQALRRIRDTATQTRIQSRKGRQDNVKGAFVLKGDRGVRGRHIVVVDDVTTSGATLQEAGRTLLSGKPASLSAIVLAVADPRRRDFDAV